MRKKCIKLLSDEELRLKCVEECNGAIELNGRWSNRFKLIEDFCINNLGKTKIKLLKVENDNNVKIFKLDKHCLLGHSLSENSLSKRSTLLNVFNKRIKKIKFSIGARLVNIVYFIFLFLGQIPIVDKIIINKTFRKFLYKRIFENKR